MKVLVTGFEPFGSDTINPSKEVVDRLPNTIKEHTIYKLILPVEAYTSLHKIEEAIRMYQVDAIVCLGQAASRDYIGVERVGINVNDFRIPDNAGNQPINTKIFEDGENAYFSTLPIYSVVDAMQTCGIKAQISNSAGTYVCNHVMYGTSYLCENKNILSGFIHVPSLDTQVLNPSKDACMSLEQMVQAITLAISVLGTKDCSKKGEGCLE